jgi:hypothetical protein
VAAILLASGGAAPAEASDHGCKLPRGAKVEARTKYAVVYYDRHYRDWGCLYSLGRRAELYDKGGNVTLAGRYVAYPQTSYEPDGTVYYLVTVFDLRKRSWHSFSSAYVSQPDGNKDGEDSALVPDVALKKNGSVAWISCWPIFGDADQNNCFRDADLPPEVWRTDSRGTKMLDASADIGLRSLKRRGNTITWRRGSHRSTAQLR